MSFRTGGCALALVCGAHAISRPLSVHFDCERTTSISVDVSASTSSSLCESERLSRNRAVFRGTVGGLIAATKKPFSKRVCAAQTVCWGSPITMGMIGPVALSGRGKPASVSRERTSSHRCRRRMRSSGVCSMMSMARNAAAHTGGASPVEKTWVRARFQSQSISD